MSAPPSWQLVKTVFIEALERPNDARQAFVDQACAGDDALRAEVTSLLASERDAGSFAETPAAMLMIEDRLAPGTHVGPYRITGFIAAGGMGEVYRATQGALGRAVALKRVNPVLADTTAKRRLLREARHASVLSHPNICTIYDVGDSKGAPYIAMQLVDGISLHDRIADAAPSLDEGLDIGVQVASALEHAHRHGIIHRDLKSANVVVDAGGRAIVLDFGLAKRMTDGLLADDSQSTVSASGTFAGTLSHMAPELLRGGDADARSDIWALGVLLYELVSGRVPFTGRTAFETSSAILGDAVPPLSHRGHSTPAALRLVIERCLAKDPCARYQKAADVREALERVRKRRGWPIVGPIAVAMPPHTAARLGFTAALAVILGLVAYRARSAIGRIMAPPATTLAVMPIESAAGDSLGPYYASGITEAIIGRLGALSDARVLATSATSRAEPTAASRAALATRLNADALLEGRVRKAGDRIAIDVRLVEPRHGRVVWSDRYDRDRREVAALEEDVARAIAAEVRARPRPNAAAPRAVNPDAYEEYLKGRFEWNKRTAASLRAAVAHFQAAADDDPTFAPAHAALADCYNQLATQMVGAASPREYRPLAAAEAIRALQTDPYSAEAHAALGYVRHYEWQWSEAEREFRRAIELNPSYALAHLWFANLLMSRRRFDEALAQARLARDLDPFSLVINTNIAWILTAAGRTSDAIGVLRETLRLDSTYAQANSRLIDALVTAGRMDEARHRAELLASRSPGTTGSIGLLALVDALTGRPGAARPRLATVLARAQSEYVAPGSIALVYSALHDTIGQDAWLERAYDEHSNAIAYLASDERLWVHDGSYARLLAKAGLR
ncbi:MAG TPA: protein kinase [Gemmatimonadaceae bacterium]|nr:protein kinase [Gemmatimonadaceae bacterium]